MRSRWIHKKSISNIEEFNKHLGTKKPTKGDIDNLKKEMLKSATNLEFEKASKLRDEVRRLEALLLS